MYALQHTNTPYEIHYNVLQYITISFNTLPVVPHKAVAEVSKLGNL